ncbi:MAG: hypothetical protein ACXABY_36375 [Candidatus Thorarchaeota archaeon]|jgi:hypothetical protein
MTEQQKWLIDSQMAIMSAQVVLFKALLAPNGLTKEGMKEVSLIMDVLNTLTQQGMDIADKKIVTVHTI